MTVKELMEILATMPENATACTWDPDYYTSPTAREIEDVTLPDKNTVIIW